MAEPLGFDFQLEDGQTPLDADEARGLQLSWVATRGDLNDAEGANIFTAMRWAAREIRKKNVVVSSEDFQRRLHGRMFGEVWEWAGRFRLTERNIGVAPIRSRCSCGSFSAMLAPGRSSGHTRSMSKLPDSITS